jgi:hypothetical protein
MVDLVSGPILAEPAKRARLTHMWWLSFLDGGIVILEASSLTHAA